MIAECRKALRITTTSFDDEILDLIKAGVKDVQITGCVFTYTITNNDVEIADALVKEAVKTYVRCRFGEPNDYDRIKASYDEQKAQLRANSDYMEV